MAKPVQLADQYEFVFYQSRCTGCKTCEVACKDFHAIGGEMALRTIYEYTGGEWSQDADGAWDQNVYCYHVSLSCNHCTNPLCMRFCSHGAISKDEHGFVVIDEDSCEGCQMCKVACPYNAPRFSEERGVMSKCDGCVDRIAQGKQPVCVDSCPQRALFLRPREAHAEDADAAVLLTLLPSPSLTMPNVHIVPCQAAISHVDQRGEITNLRET